MNNLSRLSPLDPVRVGLWGGNGHQIQRKLDEVSEAKVVVLGGFEAAAAVKTCAAFPEARWADDYEDFVKTPGLELASLCAPVRRGQAALVIHALEMDISVYAEKPCAASEDELDALLAAASRSRGCFHEMAGTVCGQPYWTLRQRVLEGVIGEVVQVFAQKSYPYHDGRPVLEAIDGGLIAQNGVHAMRFVEHITGLRAETVRSVSTGLGERRAGSDLKMACALTGALNNGGIYSVIANYLNPQGFGSWGNECVRIFGTEGMIESVDGGSRTRLVVGGEDLGSVQPLEASPDWLRLVLQHVRGEDHFPFDLQAELHPTRMVVRAGIADECVFRGGEGEA